MGKEGYGANCFTKNKGLSTNSLTGFLPRMFDSFNFCVYHANSLKAFNHYHFKELSNKILQSTVVCIFSVFVNISLIS